MTELIGQALGSYQIEALLGAGPAGPRYAARHLRLQRPAALRLFSADLAARPLSKHRATAVPQQEESPPWGGLGIQRV